MRLPTWLARKRHGLLMAVLLAGVGLVAGCGGDDEESARPLTLEQRLPAESDVPNEYSVKDRFTFEDVDSLTSEGLALPEEAAVAEARQVLTEAGYASGVGRVFSKNDDSTATGEDFLVFMALRFESDSTARDVIEWIHDQDLKPCVGVCTIRISEFEVDGIPDALGVERVGGPHDKEAGRPDRYLVYFSDGPVGYLVERAGPTGNPRRDEAIDAAEGLYERVKDAPLPAA